MLMQARTLALQSTNHVLTQTILTSCLHSARIVFHFSVSSVVNDHMAQTSSLVFAGIAPHPPIMVPEVGRESSIEVQNSINAMAELTARVISSKAETVIIISPHAPLEANAFIAYGGPQIHGD